MLKTLLVTAVILVIISVTLSALGQRSEYIAEKLMYQASSKYDTIISNPDVVPPAMIKYVEGNLKKVIEKFPEGRTARLAHLKLVEVYFANKKYDEALLLTDNMLTKYSDEAVLSSKAQLTRAAVYESKGNWARAEQELVVLQERYANTPIGLRAPYYIASYYKRSGDEQQVDRVLNEAVKFYANLKEEHQGSQLGYESSSKLMETYLNLKRYEEAGKAIKGLIEEYPGSATVLKHSAYIDIIFVDKLQDPEEAIEIYQYGIEHAGNDKIRQYFQKKIELITEKGQKVSNSKS